MERNDTPCKRQDPGTDTLAEVLPLGLIWTSDDEFAILVPFNLSFKKLIQDAHRDYYTSIYIGGRPISNVEFADDIDLMDGTSSKPQDHTN
ncbi:hypothetical protein DPMN_014619 [Dreissena polymorpha]|uniref:Uncharacterized protein n=1 Tax=Dreissena polymorpha TaxID=45954 RepID=A0A9D4S4R1_DREPO|nr:hypothetical protein DPMN_014619 [Dreissena polymorpha]